ncbi:MAG TPA: hypothetical protein PK189_11440, partial [bacterium]|nr:hypothetical protein [bacterium]
IDLKDNENYEIQFAYLRENASANENTFITSLISQEEKSKVIDTNKCIGHKKIFSINTYTFYFKLFATSNTTDKANINEIKVKAKSEFNSESFKNYIIKIFDEKINFILEKSKEYYNQIIDDYYDKEREKDKIKQIEKIKNFINKKLKEILFEKVKIVPDLYLVNDKFNGSLLDSIIWINFKVDKEILIDASNRYFQKEIFVKKDYNEIYNNELYGLSSFYNGDNSKKLFLQHRTALFNVNNLIKYNHLDNLQKFRKLLKNKKLPNPLPIFIDKEELNSRVIKIFNFFNKGKLKYSEIIKQLLEKEKVQDLNNYYLFYFFKDNIVDFDYVSCFRYALSDMNIYDFFGINDNLPIEIKTIFDFERIVIGKIFNNSLVIEKKEGNYFTYYFEDINRTYIISSAILNNIYKYRKAIYDYIYKSRTEAITAQMLKDIILTSIFADIKSDEYEYNKHTKGYSIKEKLNIYLSINHHFDKTNKNFGGFYMPNKLPELVEKTKAIANNDNNQIESDEEFAFAAGQIIYYLLDQSETSNKTHALLEPFIQKTEINLFKETIIKTINKYKHNLEWYGKAKGRFERLAAQILAYIPEKKIQELMPFILCGYFAKSVIYEKTIEEDKKDE